ncbi:MAG: hypothetical protein ACOC0U_07420, partial [Desulfovibrionales bacterium]
MNKSEIPTTKTDFLAWMEKQEKTIRIYLDQELTAEALELTNSSMDAIIQARDWAGEAGLADLLKEKHSSFRAMLKEGEDLQKKYEDDDVLPEDALEPSDDFTPQGLCARGEALFDLGEYDKALKNLQEAYSRGLANYSVAFLILECLNKKGQLQEQVEFIQQGLSNLVLLDEEKAKLFYRLGVLYLHLKKPSQARQALWQVKRIDPDFPGLDAKLKPLEKKKERSNSRYDLLLREGKIDQALLKRVLEEARQNNTDPDQLLLQDHGISKAELGDSLSEYYNVPFVAYDSTIEPPFELFEKKKLDPDFLKKAGWVPFSQEGRNISILMADPFDLDKLGEIKFLFETGGIEPKVALVEDINQFVENFYRALSADQELSQIGEDLDVDAYDEPIQEMDLQEEVLTAKDSEVVRLVNALLIEAWRRNVSDIHIEPNPR